MPLPARRDAAAGKVFGIHALSLLLLVVRRVLSGGLACAAALMAPGGAGAALSATLARAAGRDGMAPPASDAHGAPGPDEQEDPACHAPFRAAFLAWLNEASGRFALPVSVDVAETSHTSLRIPGLHPALDISLSWDTDINVFVTWRGVFWDILTSMDVYAEAVPDGSGWLNGLVIPEARRLYSTREACWREDGFEWLLRWINDALVPATHLALYGGDGCFEGEGWTSAHLARDGIVLRTGRPVRSDGLLRGLLPLHASRA